MSSNPPCQVCGNPSKVVFTDKNRGGVAEFFGIFSRVSNNPRYNYCSRNCQISQEYFLAIKAGLFMILLAIAALFLSFGGSVWIVFGTFGILSFGYGMYLRRQYVPKHLQ